jgi:hypothetical protein
MSETNVETPEVDTQSLADALSAEFDKAEQPESPVEQPEKVEEPEASEAEDEETEIADEDEQEAEEAPAIETPEALNAAQKEAFAAIPDEAKKIVSELYDSMKADYTRKTQGLADQGRLATEFQQTVQPYEALIRAEGGTPIGAVKDLLNTAYLLRQGTPQQKLSLIAQTAQQFGVDLSQLSQGYDPNSTVAQLQNELHGLKQTLNQYTTSQTQAVESQAIETIQGFQSAVGDDGNPLHPYFEDVKIEMGALLEKGSAKDLEEAYDMAVNANPRTRAILRENEGKATQLRLARERKEKAAKAKKAEGLPSGKPGASASKPKTLAEELSEQWDRSEGA